MKRTMPIHQQPRRLTTDALLVLFAGLGPAGCEKSSPEVRPEKPAAPAPSPAPSAAASPPVEAKEVPGPAPSGSSEVQKGCAPGACAPGACAGNKKE